MLLPHPCALACSHIPGTHSWLLLASDGLWDVISHAQACKLVRRAATAQRAADLLLGMVERISNEKRGRTVEKITRGAAEDIRRIDPAAAYTPAAQMAAQPAAALRHVLARGRGCARLCAWVMAWVRQARRRAWHVWRGTHSPTRRPDRTAHTTLTALTSEHTPARFGRLKDDHGGVLATKVGHFGSNLLKCT